MLLNSIYFLWICESGKAQKAVIRAAVVRGRWGLADIEVPAYRFLFSTFFFLFLLSFSWKIIWLDYVWREEGLLDFSFVGLKFDSSCESRNWAVIQTGKDEMENYIIEDMNKSISMSDQWWTFILNLKQQKIPCLARSQKVPGYLGTSYSINQFDFK